MTLDEIKKIVSNRLEFLRSQRTYAVAIGDLTQVAALDSDIAQTQSTLNSLMTI